jgi:hypothetical protein
MPKKIQHGRSLYSVLSDGMIFAVVISKIRDLHNPIDQSLLIHNLLETSPLKNLSERKQQVTENLKRLKAELGPRIEEINSNIQTLNIEIKGLDFKYTIPKLKTSEILRIVERRMKTLLEVDDAQEMGNELFRKSLNDAFRKTNEPIFDFLKEVKKEQFENKLENLNEIYRHGIRQALHICSIGYYTTSVFVAGRTVEESVNDYYKLLFKLKKIDKVDLTSSKFSFENKINKLKSEKLITEVTYHNLSNIRIDRNKFGHPSSKTLNKDEAHLKIQIILSEIPEIQKKMSRLKV